MIRVLMPAHLRTLARITTGSEIEIDVAPPITVRRVVDAIEERWPMLRGTIRDQGTKVRRPFIRFYACMEDLSHDSIDDELPEEVVNGTEPLMIVGAMAGG